MGGLQRIMAADIQVDAAAKTVYQVPFPDRVNAAFMSRKKNELYVYNTEPFNLLCLDATTYAVKEKNVIHGAVPLIYMRYGSAEEIVFLNSFQSFNFTQVYVYNTKQRRMTARLQTNDKELWSIANTNDKLFLQATSNDASFASVFSTKSKKAFIKTPLKRVIEDSSFVASDTTMLTCSWGGKNNSRVDFWYWDDLQPLIPQTVPLQDRYANRVFPNVQVKKQTITLSLWDNATIDGDRVTVMLNDNVVVSDYELTATPKNITLNLLPQYPNQITIHANSVGRLPPNTVSLRIDDGKKTETMVLKADLNSSEYFLIFTDK